MTNLRFLDNSGGGAVGDGMRGGAVGVLYHYYSYATYIAIIETILYNTYILSFSNYFCGILHIDNLRRLLGGDATCKKNKYIYKYYISSISKEGTRITNIPMFDSSAPIFPLQL